MGAASMDSYLAHRNWLASLKVGDAVAVEDINRIVWRGFVESITPTGLIRVRSEHDKPGAPDTLLTTFRKNGQQRDPVYHFRRIVQPKAATP